MQLRSELAVFGSSSRALPVGDARRFSNRSTSSDRSGDDEILGMDLEQFRLCLKVAELEEELWHARRSNLTGFVALIGKIHEISKEIFPGPVSMEYASDPEDPTNEYMVFDVVAKGNFADYKNLIYQWHDEVEKLCPGTLSEFRLIVHPKP